MKLTITEMIIIIKFIFIKLSVNNNPDNNYNDAIILTNYNDASGGYIPDYRRIDEF